ncbi:hypothetical protein S7711_11309 [Stachybotrys chartarum IBT 7711]|uniref:Uncharacterized protein n=1 Tax=Stachybotrys chartarum (strain CBS 109288 / IBT 7711) TaxID=1280523 RepID=A0A084AJP5_STACB|nr:hypothetical protein S7711_11309 [Stachybotrys chartarum IBT 7711]
MCGDHAHHIRGGPLVKITDPTPDLRGVDAEWLMRAITVYLAPEMPDRCISQLKDTPNGDVMDDIAAEVKKGTPGNEQFTPLILCLIGAYKCGGVSRAYDSSSELTLSHSENRELLRRVLHLHGTPRSRTLKEQCDMVADIVRGRGVLRAYSRMVPEEMHIIKTFIEGNHDHDAD